MMTNKPPVLLSLIFVSIIAQPNKKFTLEPGYDFHEIPPTNGKPLLVESSINFRNILEVLETQQLISLETSLRLYWKDTRVKPVHSFLMSNDSSGQYISLNPEFASMICRISSLTRLNQSANPHILPKRPILGCTTTV